MAFVARNRYPATCVECGGRFGPNEGTCYRNRKQDAEVYRAGAGKWVFRCDACRARNCNETTQRYMPGRLARDKKWFAKVLAREMA